MWHSLRYALAGVLLAGTVLAQDQSAVQDRSTLSINAAGVINRSTSDGSMTQTSTRSANVFSSYRYAVTKHHGAEISYGYTRNWQRYTVGNTAQTRVHELSASYVYSHSFKQATPFAMAGVSMLSFCPTGQGNISSTVNQRRAALLYGAGFDYYVSRHLGFRAQYRGLMFKAPTFGVSWIKTGKTTYSAQPSLGFVFRF